MSSYEVWISSDTAVRQRILSDLLSFEYVRTVNAAGAFSIALPFDFPTDLLVRDNLVEIWRAYDGGSLNLDFVGFIRKIRYTETEITISGPDMMDLLRRRFVDYSSGHAKAGYTNEADDMIKQVVRDNLAAAATAARDLTAAGFTVAADTAEGVSIAKAFAWRNVLTVCQEIAEASREAGTPVYYDIVPSVTTTALSFVFQTFVTRRGDDRTGSTLAGYDIGNLGAPVLEYDYTQEVNFCRAAGQGEQADRLTATTEDTERSGASVWARAEYFQDARQLSTAAALTDAADKRISEGRPKVTFTGTLLETPATRYGRDWAFGDEMTCTAYGLQFSANIKSVRVSVQRTGAETIDAKLEADLS